MLRAAFIILALTLAFPAHARDVKGTARVIDGDTLWLGKIKIRLNGIDAPERGQPRFCGRSGHSLTRFESPFFWNTPLQSKWPSDGYCAVSDVSAYSRYIISWKLCTDMRAEDVTDTLDLALQASGCDQVHVVHKPRLLSDNGSS